ncbi:MAG: hypothetical protein PHT33_12415, partial [bacterium]|nr:hypothetical protein [bacterium]
AQAYTLLGLHAYLSRFEGDLASRRLQKRLTNRLLSAFKKNRKEEWPWPEDILTYDNARLPQALILSGHQMGDSKAIDIGLKALDWLFELQTHRCGHLSIIGNDGWCVRNDRQARFDQQPLDAHGLLEAALAAYFVERSHKWLQRARQSINWFLGHNDTGEPLVDFTTGACCDGLCADGPNLNRGAESTLSWLTALLLAGGSQKLDFIWDYPKEANRTRVLAEADASSVSDGQAVGSE